MASVGEVIYEDYLYKFAGRSRSILWSKSNPWRLRYFLLKRVGNRPILEYFNKKPKSKNTTPRGKIELFPSYRVEKVTNMKNRAYVFQVTTPGCTVCLSAEEQRGMDVFVFFLQIQSRLKDQIREDYMPIQPENSEAHRRIGAKGTNSVLHVSPYGVTLALQSNRAVLAQWPLKSIRCYESSGNGQLSLEAGRVAPMGDGLYIFQLKPGDDNVIYDLIDQYVMDTVSRVQPDRRGNTEEIEDYVLEAERLLALTVVAACTSDNPEIQNIVQNNWNTEINNFQASTRPKQVVHTRLTGSESVSSLSSQNSTATPTLPARNISLASNSVRNSPRNSPQVPRSLPPVCDSPAGSRKGSLADRPPLPPPISSGPVKVPPRSAPQEPYLRMNSSVSKSSSTATPTSPWTPSSTDWVPPPTFTEAMRQKSQSPVAAAASYRPTSYLSPTSGPTSYLSPTSGPTSGDSYLSPASQPLTSTPVQKFSAQRISTRDAYLTPSSFTESDSQVINGAMETDPITSKTIDDSKSAPSRPSLRRMRRLRSASCEDLSDYLKSVVYDPVSKSMNDLLEMGDDDVVPEPFPRLQTFSGSIEFCKGHSIENYYNIEGLKGKIYDGPGLSVYELRKKFSKRSHSRLRRSVSNPNFIGSISREELNAVRLKSGYGSPKHNKKSLTNLIPEAVKKRLSKESPHHSSHGALSTEGVSSHDSSRASSNRSSRHNSLSKRTTSKEDIVSKTSIEGINVTKRSRSFRRHKAHDENTSEAKADNKIKESGARGLNDTANDRVSPALNADRVSPAPNVDRVSPAHNADRVSPVPNADTSADSKDKNHGVRKPRPAPKPSPKPVLNSVPKSVPYSATNSESNNKSNKVVTGESSGTHVENTDLATTRV